MRTLQQVDAQLGQALVQARAIANGSARVHADAQSLEHALRAMVQSADATPGVACRIVYAARDLQLEQVAATHVYRIAQEAVANALKHSRATRIELGLRAHGRSFVLSVRDDGIGLPATAPRWGQLGLSIMRYRAHLIGATLSLLRAPGGGTDIRCERVAAED
jgi:signal transduction histidine kinase